MHDASDPLLRAILPKLLHATADSNSAVKLAAAEAIGGMLQEEKVLQVCCVVRTHTYTYTGLMITTGHRTISSQS